MKNNGIWGPVCKLSALPHRPLWSFSKSITAFKRETYRDFPLSICWLFPPFAHPPSIFQSQRMHQVKWLVHCKPMRPAALCASIRCYYGQTDLCIFMRVNGLSVFVYFVPMCMRVHTSLLICFVMCVWCCRFLPACFPPECPVPPSRVFWRGGASARVGLEHSMGGGVGGPV